MIRPPVSRVPDAELLARFARHRDEAAFELLVWRYQRLVGGVCRRTAGDHHAAEDAAQAAFLLLARRADRIRDAAALPGWLARVAYRCAVRARTQASGRCKPPVPATRRRSVAAGGWNGRLTPPARQDLDPESLELVATLDAELDRLPDRLRLPVVLVHLDGRTYTDAATALGIPVGTLSGRLRHARALLKDRLTRRGLAPLVVPAVVVADPARVAAVTRAALAFAAGHPAPHPSTALALGVLRAMTLPKLLAGTAAGLLATVAAVGLAATQPPAPPPPAAARPAATDFDRLQGEWLFDTATDERGGDALPSYWNARLTFRKNTVALSGSPYTEANIETTLTLDPTASPKRMDWVIPLFYQTLLKLPAGSVKGIYEFDGDGLRLCFANKPGGERPTRFEANEAKGHFVFRAERWKGKPGEPMKSATVTVLDPAGKPAAGAEVFAFRWRMPSAAPEWQQSGVTTAGADGTAAIDTTAAHWARLTARHAGRSLIGFARPVSPAALQRGVTVRLAPEVRVTGKLVSPGLPAIGWTNVYLQPAGSGGAWAGYADDAGRFEFLAPPGDYQLDSYGERVGGRRVPLAIPADKPTVDAGVIELPANRWGKLIGKPAPGLADVSGWAGEPTTLAALKGSVVLLHLWRHDFAETAEPLPKLAELADKHRAAGLRVVGVHVDRGGDVVTAQAFDAVTAKLRADKWGGKPLPFPVALTVGDKGFDEGSGFVAGSLSRVAHDYAWSPMIAGGTVLIDRAGVIRGLYDESLLVKVLAER